MSDDFSYNKGSVGIQMNFSFFKTHKCTQSFRNDAEFVLEISVMGNGQDKNASVICVTGPGQTYTNSTRPEQDPVCELYWDWDISVI